MIPHNKNPPQNNIGGNPPNVQPEERTNKNHPPTHNEINTSGNVYQNHKNPPHTTKNNRGILPNFQHERNGENPPPPPSNIGLGKRQYPNPPQNGYGYDRNNVANPYGRFDRNPPFNDGLGGNFIIIFHNEEDFHQGQ